jgi:hypothetical protein
MSNSCAFQILTGEIKLAVVTGVGFAGFAFTSQPRACTDLNASLEHISKMRCRAVTLSRCSQAGPRCIVPIAIMHVLWRCVAGTLCIRIADCWAIISHSCCRIENAMGRSWNRDVRGSSVYTYMSLRASSLYISPYTATLSAETFQTHSELL